MMDTANLESGLTLNRDEAIKEYAHLVDKIAQRVIIRLPPNVDIDDLKSAGIIGLIDAIEKYSEEKGSNFKVYAEIRIRGAIIDELRAQDWVPRSVRDRKNLLQRATQTLTQELKRPPTHEELADHLEISQKEYQSLRRRAEAQSMISYEDLNTRHDGSHRDILESIPDHNQSNPESIKEYNDEISLIYTGLKRLPERQRMVLSLYYFEDMKLKDIGILLGVSESRVSQIQTQAVAQLKPIIEKLS